MKRSAATAARRYARALLDVALAQADPAVLRTELDQARALLETRPDLRGALTHPGLGAERRQRLVKAVFADATPLLQRLLLLLAEKGQIGLVAALAPAFAQAFNQHRGVVTAEAVSAVALDQPQHEALLGALRQATGAEVELTASVDAAVIGGLVVTMGGRTYDGSVRAQLQALRRRLVHGARA